MPAKTLIHIEKQTPQGRTLYRYQGWLLDEGEPIQILARWQLPDLPKPYTTFARGDLLLEFFYRQRPYNIFALFDGRAVPSATDFGKIIAAQPAPVTFQTLCRAVGGSCPLKGYYINFTRPLRYHADQRLLAWRDVALDMWIPLQGPPQMLDEADYRVLNLPATDPHLARAIENARQDLLQRLQTPESRLTLLESLSNLD